MIIRLIRFSLLLVIAIVNILVFQKCTCESEEESAQNPISKHLEFEFEGKYYSIYEIMHLKGHQGEIYSMDISPNGKIIASAGNNKKIILWSAENGKILHELKGHQEKINSIDFSSGGARLASGSDDQSIKIWSVKSGKLLKSIVKYAGPVSSVCFSPKGSFIASAYGNNNIRLWSTQTSKLSKEIKTDYYINKVNSVEFFPDGQNLVGFGDELFICSRINGKVEKRYNQNLSLDLKSISFNNKYLIAGGSKGSILSSLLPTPYLLIWSLKNNEGIQIKDRWFSVYSREVHSVSLNKDNKMFICGYSNNKIGFFSIQTGKMLINFDAHQKDVNSVKYLPDYSGFVSASSDSTLKIWKILEEGETPPDQKIMLVDNNPPKIIIEKPSLTRGIKFKSVLKTYRIEGRCEDESGINDIRINGKSIAFSKDGKFWTDLPLKVGDNSIQISATDIKGNRAQRLFNIDRESDYKELPKSTKTAMKNQKRLALVIGNADYKYGGILTNPLNDCKSVSAALKDLNFTVMQFENLNRINLLKAIDDFGKTLKDFNVGLFFYAGHGIQAKNYNYLVPIDANLESENDAEYNCVQAGRVLSKMEDAGSITNIIILDACRDNPFERSWTRSTSGRGLAFMNPPSGSLIAYATSPGKTALDGSGDNGLYTSALLDHISTAGMKIEDVFKRVRATVEERSNNQQTPWESTSLKGDFYFNPGF